MNQNRTKQRLFFLFGCFFIGFYAQASIPVDHKKDKDFQYRDSLRNHIFENGFAEVNCYLSYPIGDSLVDPGFGNNASELNVLSRFLRYALEDTLVCVQQINIIGYSSIDGASKINERLAQNRAKRFLDYLDIDHHISDKYMVEINSVGADWKKFRELIAASAYKWREDALRIIDGPGTNEWKKMQISYLGGGDGHKKMYELYPLLRRVEIKIIYDVQCMKGKLHRSGLPKFGDFTIPALKLNAMNKLPVRKHLLYPVFALSTNLVTASGVAVYDNHFYYRTPMPNLSAEFFWSRRWSVVASGAYSYWKFDGNRHFWGISAYSLEPRIWLNGNRHFRGVYFGLFGQMGEFDIQYGKNNTGTYWQAGLTAGYYLPLSRHWGVGIGLRGGYECVDAKSYSIESSHYYYDHAKQARRWGLKGIELSLGYRFGR